jgi:hypothetical protein
MSVKERDCLCVCACLSVRMGSNMSVLLWVLLALPTSRRTHHWHVLTPPRQLHCAEELQVFLSVYLRHDGLLLSCDRSVLVRTCTCVLQSVQYARALWGVRVHRYGRCTQIWMTLFYFLFTLSSYITTVEFLFATLFIVRSISPFYFSFHLYSSSLIFSFLFFSFLLFLFFSFLSGNWTEFYRFRNIDIHSLYSMVSDIPIRVSEGRIPFFLSF